MKYQFQTNPGEFSYKPRLFTNAIKVLISINFVIFILQTLSRSEALFFPLFGLVPKLVWSEKMIWQPVTYLFFHGGIWHVLINMFVLWMFGSELERFWGKKHFLKFYFITGVGSGLVTMLVNIQSITPVVGASGAVTGVVYSAVLLYPEMQLAFLFFPIPLPGYIMATLYLIYTLYGMKKQQDNIGHTAHFGGAISGLLATIAFQPDVLYNSALTLGILVFTIIIAGYFFKK